MTLSVFVAEGSVQINGATVAITDESLVLGAADADDPRFDLIAVDDTGTKSVVAGTPATNPVYPAIPADSVVLAAVYVQADQTVVFSANIVDKRVIVTPPTLPYASMAKFGVD